MSEASEKTATVVYDALTGDATLAAIVTGWYEFHAPQGTDYPFGVFQFSSVNPQYAFGNNLALEQHFLQIKVLAASGTSTTQSPNELTESALQRVNAILDGLQTTNTGSTLQFRRENEIPYIETVQDKTIHTRSALYRVTVG